MQEYAEEGMAQHMLQLQKGINARSDFKNGKIWKGREKFLDKAAKESDRWRNLEEDGLSDKEIRASFDIESSHESI